MAQESNPPTAPPSIITLYPPPEGGVLFGSDRLLGVQFAAIIQSDYGPRFLHGYSFHERVVWDLFLWHPQAQVATYEVRASRPVGTGGWVTGDDSMEFTSLDDGFSFKLGSDGSIEMGLGAVILKADAQKVDISGGITMSNNVTVNAVAHLVISDKGDISIGSGGNLPDGMFTTGITFPGSGPVPGPG